MIDDDFLQDNEDNLMDEDPALDYLLYKKMTENDSSENRSAEKQNGGCLGTFVLFILPVAAGAPWLLGIW